MDGKSRTGPLVPMSAAGVPMGYSQLYDVPPQGMLPQAPVWLLDLIRMLMQSQPQPQPQPPGIPGVNGGPMPPAPRPGGMLPLPSSPRG